MDATVPTGEQDWPEDYAAPEIHELGSVWQLTEMNVGQGSDTMFFATS